MTKGNAFVYMSAAILSCCCYLASSAVTNTIESTGKNKDFLKPILEEYTEFMIETLKHNHDTLQAVLNDATIKGNKDVRVNILLMSGAAGDLENLPTERFMYLPFYQSITAFRYRPLINFIKRYNTVATVNDINLNDELFRKALKSNGVQTNDMMKDLLQRFKDQTAPKLTKIMREYVDSLSAVEKRNQNDVNDLYEEFQSARDVQKKYDIFTEYLETHKEAIVKMILNE